jgi:hypothetical protein
VIPTGVFAATATEEMGNVAVDAPPTRVTVGATEVTAELLLPRLTVTPVVGAAPVKVTVPVVLFPPIKLDGSNDKLRTAGGFTVREAVLVTPKLAEMIVGVANETGTVAITNGVEVAPPGIFTVPGGTTAAVLLANETETPPLGAGPVRVMVAEVLLPPIKAVAARANVDTTGGFTVSGAGKPLLL